MQPACTCSSIVENEPRIPVVKKTNHIATECLHNTQVDAVENIDSENSAGICAELRTKQHIPVSTQCLCLRSPKNESSREGIRCVKVGDIAKPSQLGQSVASLELQVWHILHEHSTLPSPVATIVAEQCKQFFVFSTLGTLAFVSHRRQASL